MAGSGQYEEPSGEVLGRAAEAFGLLAAPARLHIVWLLAHGERDVSALAEQVGGALPAVSQHLSKLKLAGLVRSRREGRRQVYYVGDPGVVAVVRLMIGQLAEQEREQRPEYRQGSRQGHGQVYERGAGPVRRLRGTGA
ncbi:metalloregulator ArsR/SmtB family transcription factor [Streptomyces olivaceus]|uniref:ArsR/SmtB family transcription factor n=1 Tax=Streptomyces olivaceus TaxID=47716 RepID=UPI00099F90CB|nr:metalloregulator ArsR/SmtB family transcription factor [Streptomyces olivaceus]MBZ6194247.1 metalloregulator ArsR/SmtB family transcription factor [Streptomyces olivaceus]MBZ6200860.1 metalloregulator ArsR/SmtB family transcription factor [Streptomyces olivaceus]MBZ6290900.1 metalloregulator ArsR/SmtB family transcription factor [Streptomyces olivaceus]MBZ6308061.1 metalloregulator ArsR/SmtB family transcription factor [Streptomyces olivaceus]MBZ6321721.1 metalloregulator ArsR/SmtB family t